MNPDWLTLLGTLGEFSESSLSLSCLICKMGITLPTSQDDVRNKSGHPHEGLSTVWQSLDTYKMMFVIIVIIIPKYLFF